MAQLIDTVWANGLWADTVWADGVWGALHAPNPVVVEDNAAGWITGANFSRKRWRELVEARRAQQLAEEEARQLKAKKRQALLDAAAKAQQAIEAAARAEADAELNRALKRMASDLNAARQATKLVDVERQSRAATARARAIMRIVEGQQKEEEAVVSLLLM